MSGGRPDDAVLELVDITKHYRIARGPFAKEMVVKAVDGVSFTLPAGKDPWPSSASRVAASLPSPAIVTMIEPPTAGRLAIGGKDVASADQAALKALRSEVQIVFPGSLRLAQSASEGRRQFLAEPLLLNRPQMSRSERRQAALDMIGTGRAAAGASRPIPAHVLRRTETAYRHPHGR